MRNIIAVSPAYQTVSGKTVFRELHCTDKHKGQLMSTDICQEIAQPKSVSRTTIPGSHFVSIIDRGRSTSVACMNFQHLPSPPNLQCNDINRFNTLVCLSSVSSLHCVRFNMYLQQVALMFCWRSGLLTTGHKSAEKERQIRASSQWI